MNFHHLEVIRKESRLFRYIFVLNVVLKTLKSFTCESSIPFYFVNEAKDEIQMFSLSIITMKYKYI